MSHVNFPKSESIPVDLLSSPVCLANRFAQCLNEETYWGIPLLNRLQQPFGCLACPKALDQLVLDSYLSFRFID